MNFKAEECNLKLELENLDGEKKEFNTKERVTADFALKVVEQINIYITGQKKLDEKEQDSACLLYLKYLDSIYQDFDAGWVKANFTFKEIEKIKNWADSGLSGVKKDEES